MKLTNKFQLRVVLIAATVATVTLPFASAQEVKKNTALIPKATTSGTGASESEYPDVPSRHWASSAVDALSRGGYFQGYPNGTFRGDKPLTRYEYAVAQANINIDRFGPSQTEQALQNDVKRILEQLTALENRFSALEKRLNAGNSPAGMTSLAPDGNLQTLIPAIENELQDFSNSLNRVTKETGILLRNSVIINMPSQSTQ